MKTTRTHFRATTASQRRLLFETKEKTGKVAKAGRRAHVSRSTYYYWRSRFEASGFAGLTDCRSSKPHTSHRVPEAIATQVIAMRRAHLDWGKQRIADEMAKANHWQPVLSPNTVRRILSGAELWQSAPPETEHATNFKPVARTAEQPGQTVNVDLCVVPATHTEPLKLPAVSCSSGRLVAERLPTDKAPSYPGQVFADPDLDYDEAMTRFVEASAESKKALAEAAATDDPASDKERRQALQTQEQRLRLERRELREQRRAEDGLWQKQREQRREQRAIPAVDSAEKKAQQAQWQSAKQARQETAHQRREQDWQWRRLRQILCEQLALSPLIRVWYAILVVIDNCSRKSYGLPLFIAGQHVTAKEVTDALKIALPPELQYLITDRGTHFRADDFKELVREAELTHVFTARHRPQSNGIAERFVRTLKEWLLDKTWSTADELGVLLAQFDEEYNDRPHQGLPIPGLSPNEFERRKCSKGC